MRIEEVSCNADCGEIDFTASGLRGETAGADTAIWADSDLAATKGRRPSEIDIDSCDEGEDVQPPTEKVARSVTHCRGVDAVADVAAFKFRHPPNRITVVRSILTCRKKTYPTVRAEYDRFVRSIRYGKESAGAK